MYWLSEDARALLSFCTDNKVQRHVDGMFSDEEVWQHAVTVLVELSIQYLIVQPWHILALVCFTEQ